jgi:hypothetical protein
MAFTMTFGSFGENQISRLGGQAYPAGTQRPKQLGLISLLVVLTINKIVFV